MTKTKNKCQMCNNTELEICVNCSKEQWERGKLAERENLFKRLMNKFNANDEDWIRESIKDVFEKEIENEKGV